MKADVITLDAEKAGQVDLDEAVFGIEARADILHRVVTWQLARRRAGTHAVKTRGEVTGTTKKWYRQKGTGNARHGNKKPNIFRGGGNAHGPKPRDYEYSLPKKIRALGLRSALSAKQAAGKLIVVDAAALDAPKTRTLKDKLAKLSLDNALIIDGAEVDANFKRAAQNLPKIDVLPSMGANVYDILRRDTLVLTKAAVEKLEERLK
ncbi:large subunit ribosomal protein L4 [Rhodothalassium salexigens DSM 2132]|uniref:Large ribosomal subunit protein uL4 n=1 Tax=Rhodothalassium salexigens DSM 2132 TaxID=1188247 RepID=A0A4R2PC49_RHOSA|nr:50S ribosomal protein L4 [Rhodothalassium salexigens]MBB4212391.1 large subunit ribosomal protein L4 [Rhodothalassium salexigens DSM 2132]MBK1637815.1 50S ribosomal protein L4 [Rhodothalassium salexigens DSM 2132]TCP31978.1 large subunit ribosomal protein L4 [Rhodothalassium salexigens DSM 2132]